MQFDELRRREFIALLGGTATLWPLAAVAAIFTGALPVAAQDYPTRLITLVVPFPAGGGNDTVARVVAEKMSRMLGQQVVVENRGGAGGTIATRAVARDRPDGYTILLTYTGTLCINPTLYSNAGYDPRKDFAPIGLIGWQPSVLTVHPSLPARTPSELVAYAKANPGKVNYAFVPGTIGQMTTEMFARSADIELTRIPYKSICALSAALWAFLRLQDVPITSAFLATLELHRAVWSALSSGGYTGQRLDSRRPPMAKLNLQTPTSRGRLAPRGKPYAVRLIPGVWLGYRAAVSGTGAWAVIAADGKGGRWQKVIGHADDKQASDGTAVLTYEQAANKARALARGDANAAADRPVSIGVALTAYEADLTARGRGAYNARWVAHHLPRHLAAQPLSQVTSKQLRSWRDGLIKAGMLPATVNRVLKPAHAAFNLAAKLDARVAANAQAWKVGLEALHGTVKAREAVLSDQQVLAVVATAYEISEQFGFYVQAHAELGARSSQIARCTVGDLLQGKLSVPASHKGRGGGRGGHVPIPITLSLAARLRRAAAGRPMQAPLLVREDGTVWQPKNADHRHPFAQAARAAGLPAGTTIYSLRHSSIVRALRANVPIKIVADWHDTSTAIIEKHYAKFITHHADDLIRAALLDTTPTTSPGKVIPLR